MAACVWRLTLNGGRHFPQAVFKYGTGSQFCKSRTVLSCQPWRSMGIFETYLEPEQKKEKKQFENPLDRPKLEEVETDDIEKILAEHTSPDDNDMPLLNLPNPYVDPAKRCIICEKNIQLDYKNTRLLSQFISPYTGQIYGRHITGLCIYMQNRVARLIKRARFFGFLPYIYKNPQYLRDPKLFNPFKRQ